MTKQSILSPPEVAYALSIATERYSCKAGKGTRISKKHTGFAVNFAGVVGELCFRKVYGGKINTAVLPNGDNHAPDIILDDGREVEVKTSLFGGNPVIIFEDNELDCAKHVSLVKLTLPDWGMVYPIYTWDYVKPRLTTTDFGYGKRWVFDPSKHEVPC